MSEDTQDKLPLTEKTGIDWTPLQNYGDTHPYIPNEEWKCYYEVPTSKD